MNRRDLSEVHLRHVASDLWHLFNADTSQHFTPMWQATNTCKQIMYAYYVNGFQ